MAIEAPARAGRAPRLARVSRLRQARRHDRPTPPSPAAPRRRPPLMARKGHRPSQAAGNRPRFWGRHAVLAALANPERTMRKLYGTREALAGLDLPSALQVTYADVADLGRLVPADAPHQGLVADVDPLEEIWLGDLLAQGDADPEAAGRPLVVLDQVTDPHNVGAILRSAAAFDALGIVTQDRHAPPESGTVARAASGALETVPWVRVVNLARALEEIAEASYWRIGLTGHADQTLSESLGNGRRFAIVLGAEGEGMRQNTEAHCDELARLPISQRVESLNVSNAAAIALYAVAARE
jgi:23S rRNA (guanosine2251-2'-O)-methyltransferase